MDVHTFGSFAWIFLHLEIAGGMKCEDPVYREQSSKRKLSLIMDESRPPTSYNCPREHDPETLTECCWDGGCCPKNIFSFSQMDEWLMMVTGIVVISLCMILTAAVILCCFWSKCPLYNTCRTSYNTSDVIVYSLTREEDPLSLMPLEGNGGHNYKPIIMRVKPVHEI